MRTGMFSARARILAHRLAHPLALLKSLSDPIDELTLLANRFGSDKGDLHRDRQGYTRIYSSLFEPLRNAPIRLLELGLLHRGDRGWKNVAGRFHGTAIGSRAPSLEMWSSYFPKATIFGFDINPFPDVTLDRCTIITGDMGKRDDLDRLVRESGGDFDIIIDDASHASHHQQVALGFLFPHLRAGGLYIIEDLGFQPPELELSNARKTRDVLHDAAATKRFVSEVMTKDEAEYLAREIDQITFFDSTTRGNASRFVDALAVLRKKPQ